MKKLLRLPSGRMKEAVFIATNEPRRIRRAASNATATASAAKRTPAPPVREPAPAPGKKSRPKKKHRVLLGILRLIATLVCLGIMAGSALAVGVCSYVADATADDGELLDLDRISLNLSSTVYAPDPDSGEQLEYGKFISGDSYRIWVDLEDIPQTLQWAFICTEDKGFYEEPGINFKRTVGAVINQATGNRLYGSQQGASTLEQQLIKNLLDDDASSGLEGIKRKIREIFRAIGLDNKYSKATILDAYLNTISFTNTIQGVQTAANVYFGKDVANLTTAECAVIASITKNPTAYNPYTNPESLLERRHLVLWNMKDQGKISEAEYQAADAEPLTLAEEDTTAVKTTTSNNSYFTDALYEELIGDMVDQLDMTKEAARNLLYTGGLQIYATVNTKIQSAMEQIMLNTDDEYFVAGWREEEVSALTESDTPVYNEDGTLKTKTADDGTVSYYRSVRTQASMVTMDYEGNVLALVGGLGEKNNDLVLNRAYDVPRQTGSQSKPISAYSQGIESGLFNWSSMIDDAPLYAKEDMIVRDDDYCKKHGLSSLSDDALKAYPEAWRDWPRNYENTYSLAPTPLWKGLARSMNTIAARIGDTVGVDPIFDFMYNTLQLNTLDTQSDHSLAPLVLGSQTHGVTTTQLAAAYQIFYEGIYTTPHLYSTVYDSDGNLLMESNATSYQALTPETATIMNRLLRNVFTTNAGPDGQPVSGTAAGLTPKAGGMEAVGKTGTASDYKDYGFTGLTPYYVTSVWWGYDSPFDMYSYGVKTGNTALKSNKPCKTAWKALMEAVQGDLEYKAFPVSDNVVQREYCVESGLLATDTCVNRLTGYYKADDLPDYCDYGY